jgi:glutamyl-tRNA reductase
MAALARHADEIQDRETEAILAQLSHLSDTDREAVRALGRAISKKLVHAPLRHLREAGAQGSPDVDALRRAFNLESEYSQDEEAR